MLPSLFAHLLIICHQCSLTSVNMLYLFLRMRPYSFSALQYFEPSTHFLRHAISFRFLLEDSGQSYIISLSSDIVLLYEPLRQCHIRIDSILIIDTTAAYTYQNMTLWVACISLVYYQHALVPYYRSFANSQRLVGLLIFKHRRCCDRTKRRRKMAFSNST